MAGNRPFTPYIPALNDGALRRYLVNDNGELEEAFLDFEAGTDREDIWHWIEEKFDCSIEMHLRPASVCYPTPLAEPGTGTLLQEAIDAALAEEGGFDPDEVPRTLNIEVLETVDKQYTERVTVPQSWPDDYIRELAESVHHNGGLNMCEVETKSTDYHLATVQSPVLGRDAEVSPAP